MKTFKVVYTPRAAFQMANLYSYIARDSGEVRAEKFTGGIAAACAALSSFPERGTKRDDIRPNLRIFGYAKRVTIAISVNPESFTVVILGIYYGGQNYALLLDETGNDG